MAHKIEDDRRHIEATTIQEISNYADGSIHIAGILIANLMLLNGGALFVFPAYIGAKSDAAIMPTSLIANSATAFVIGIVFSAMCGYFAYLNYQFNASSRIVASHKRIIELQQEGDLTTKHRRAEWYADTIVKLTKNETKWDSYVSYTFWLGQVTGILSLITFVIGCYLARVAMLP